MTFHCHMVSLLTPFVYSELGSVACKINDVCDRYLRFVRSCRAIIMIKDNVALFSSAGISSINGQTELQVYWEFGMSLAMGTWAWPVLAVKREDGYQVYTVGALNLRRSN